MSRIGRSDKNMEKIVCKKKIGYSAGLILLFCLIFFSAIRCTDPLNVGFYSKKNPGNPFTPPHYLSGTLEGYRFIMDHDENILDTAHITRVCIVKDDTEGSCKDTIHYALTGAHPVEELNWNIEYSDSGKMSVIFNKGTPTESSGSISGAMMILSGEKYLPLQQKKKAYAIQRFHLLPGKHSVLLEKEKFYFLKITEIGKTETIWFKR